MKRKLRVLAIVSLLCGLMLGGVSVWMYYRARAQAEEGMNLQKKSLRLYDQSDTVKGTPEENRLIEEGQRYEQAGDETLLSARNRLWWAKVSVIGSIAFLLISIATMMAHLKGKKVDLPS